MNKLQKNEPGGDLTKSEIRLKELPKTDMKKFLFAEYCRLCLLNSQPLNEGADIGTIVDELFIWLRENWPGANMNMIHKTFMTGLTAGHERRIWISFPLLITWLINHRQAGIEKPDKTESEPIHVQAARIFELMKKRGIDVSKIGDPE